MEGSGGGGGGANQLNPVVTDPRQQLQQLKLGDPSLQVEEEASPISSRPPAMAVPHSTSSSSAAGLFEDELLTGGERGIGGRIEMAGGGNRWPRQETVALLRIRSEMDTNFRDANPKGPLWEEVSRKLGELGYKRSAKKCKEKFENVHKYYKRTKEGRAGRQDGKSYKFFSELEALTAATSSSSSMPPPLPQQPPPPAAITAGIAFSSPAPISSSIRFQQNLMFSVTPPPPQFSDAAAAAARPITTSVTPPPDFNRPATNIGISFSSDTNSSFANSDSSDSDRERKRKRTSSSSPQIPATTSAAGNERMAEFFQRLVNQVLQKQETMQQRFLEAIEKREHDRMIREEAWKRQETIRLAKEQELIAQERAMSASRDSAIIAFLQKITGQTIQFPPAPIPVVPPPPPPSSSSPIQPPPISSRELVLATPDQHQKDISIAEPSSSRWPKEEILALIELRSGLEYKYLESGPKGPLWEEISAGMSRMGYRRNARRCKEKWENINKYYKKVKESKKKRPEESKTCPYYHQLDELYRNKILGGVKPEEQQQQPGLEEGDIVRKESSGGDGLSTANLFGEGSAKKPEEDNVRGTQQEQQFIMGDYGKIDEDKSDDIDLDEEEEDDDDQEEDMIEEEEEMKMAYKIEFKGQNTASSNGGGGNGAPSFLTMVQ